MKRFAQVRRQPQGRIDPFLSMGVMPRPAVPPPPPGRPASVRETYGFTLSLDQVCVVLGMSRTTAKRRMAAGTFPIPSLPRQMHECYRFTADRVDRYLARAEQGVVLSTRGIAKETGRP